MTNSTRSTFLKGLAYTSALSLGGYRVWRFQSQKNKTQVQVYPLVIFTYYRRKIPVLKPSIYSIIPMLT